MSILKKLSMILGGNLRILNQQVTQSPSNSARACARHPEHKAIGVCKYCERELCSECLVQKKGTLWLAPMVLVRPPYFTSWPDSLHPAQGE